jgi:hypothetical protein
MQVSIAFAGATVAEFQMPAINARAGVDNVIALSSPVVVPVANFPAFTAFATALIQQPTVSFTLSGSASVTTEVAGTAVTIRGVPFVKTVTLPGAGGLTQSSVESFSLLSACPRGWSVGIIVSPPPPPPPPPPRPTPPARADSNATAAVANMTVRLQNPSPVSIQPIGDLAVNVVFEGSYMGTVVARNVSLNSGTNDVTFLGLLVSSRRWDRGGGR